MLQLEKLTNNLTAQPRYEMLGGLKYLVTNSTMIVTGVLKGSAGSLFYPQEEVEKSVMSWNMMPLTLGHPKNEDGSALSARSPSVLSKSYLGFVFNAKMSEGNLTAESWFDVKRTNALAPILLSKLESGSPVELSTGLYTENIPVKNKIHNGKRYDAVAKNYRPDHLAILMNEKGACSIYDGCGVNNELAENKELPKGRKLNKPFRTSGGPKKFAVYTKNDKGNVVIVRFGDPNMEIKRDDPGRKKNFRARHNCSSPGPKYKARYWSCKMWSSTPVSKIVNEKNQKSVDANVCARSYERKCPFGS